MLESFQRPEQRYVSLRSFPSRGYVCVEYGDWNDVDTKDACDVDDECMWEKNES